MPTNTLAPASPIPTNTPRSEPGVDDGDTVMPLSLPPTSSARLIRPTDGNKLPDFGMTVNLHGQLTNEAARQQFLKNYAQGQAGRWEYVLYTIEGAPVSHLFEYAGQDRQYQLLVDNTKDGFAAPADRRTHTYSCQGLSQQGQYLKMSGCFDGKQLSDLELP